jgi:hypothetical protein
LRPGRISIITHPSQFVKRKVAQISNNYFSHNCAILPIDFCELSAIIQVQGVRKTKVACECVNTEVKWHGEEPNPICPILGADDRQWFTQPSEAKIIFQNPLTTE